MIGQVTSLTKCECETATYIAKRRVAFDRKDPNWEITPYGPEDLRDWPDNYGAEIAYCKMFNLFPDLGWEERLVYDCISARSNTIDVKNTAQRYNMYFIKAKKWDTIPDFFAFMISKLPSYEFRGFIEGKEAITKERYIGIDSPMYKQLHLKHPVYVVYETDLADLEVPYANVVLARIAPSHDFDIVRNIWFGSD